MEESQDTSTQAPSSPDTELDEDMLLDDLLAEAEDEVDEEDNTSDNTAADSSDDEPDQQDKTETKQSEGDDGEADGEDTPPDPSQMTDAERNRYFAERRIAAKSQDKPFIDSLREDIIEQYVNVDPNEESYADMEPGVAEQLREVNARQRQQDAERAIEKIENSRESIRLSTMQAEASIPVFNPSSKDYNEELHHKAMQDYALLYLEFTPPDKNGDIHVVGTQDGAPTILEYLTEQASFYDGLVKSAREQGQQIAARNAARSEIQSASSLDVKDKDFDGWDDDDDDW